MSTFDLPVASSEFDKKKIKIPIISQWFWTLFVLPQTSVFFCSRKNLFFMNMVFKVVGFATTTNGFPRRVLSLEEIINLIAASHKHFPTKQCLVIVCSLLFSSLVFVFHYYRMASVEMTTGNISKVSL
jgi:hypothetical protein